MITEKENSFGDVDYVCFCGAPVVREEIVCPCCGNVLDWVEFDEKNPGHKIHA